LLVWAIADVIGAQGKIARWRLPRSDALPDLGLQPLNPGRRAGLHLDRAGNITGDLIRPLADEQADITDVAAPGLLQPALEERHDFGVAHRHHFFLTCLASLPIFRPRSADMNSLATLTGIGFLPWARSFARPAAVCDMAANPCCACDSLATTQIL